MQTAVSLLLAQSSPLSQGAARIFSSITSTSVLCVTQERLMCSPEWVPGCGGEREFGVPHCLLQHPPIPDSPARGDILGRRCCSM